jgi:hypothetical protein
LPGSLVLRRARAYSRKRAPEHYIRWYETNEGETDKGDRNEGSANTTDGGTGENKDWVISCWTILKRDKPTSDEWNIFKKDDQNIVAIVSTPSKVCKFLEKTFETDKEQTKRKFPFYLVEPNKVNYGNKIDPAKIIDAVPFNKDVQFTKQQEYRFALRCYHPNIIDSLIFCDGIDYMEKCFANPEMCTEKKYELRVILEIARCGYGDFEGKEIREIIDNADILFE